MKKASRPSCLCVGVGLEVVMMGLKGLGVPETFPFCSRVPAGSYLLPLPLPACASSLGSGYLGRYLQWVYQTGWRHARLET